MLILKKNIIIFATPLAKPVNTMSTIKILLSLLDELALAMEQQNLWQLQPISAEAYASTAPFACDHLSFEQWLQFILLPKMRVCCQQNRLPKSMEIAPMAEIAFADHPGYTELHDLLQRFDQCINQQGQQDA